MLPRDIVPLPDHIYPPDEWRIREVRYPEEHVPRAETAFALSNGRTIDLSLLLLLLL